MILDNYCVIKFFLLLAKHEAIYPPDLCIVTNFPVEKKRRLKRGKMEVESSPSIANRLHRRK